MPTPADPPELCAEDVEVERVRAWRVAHLEALGLPYPVALELALGAADWHRIERAMVQGMTPEQVASVFLQVRLLCAVVAAIAVCLALPGGGGSWNRWTEMDDIASWLAMRPVYVKCLNVWESDKDFVIAGGAVAYVEGFYEQDGRWHPDDHMIVRDPICRWFVALARGDTGGYDFRNIAFSVLVLTHESGHLRGWNKRTLVSDSEASTQRWALRHVYAVAKRIGLSDAAAVLILRYAVQSHMRLPDEYHAVDCERPYVDAGGQLRGCGP